jgi:hypothetical protein
MLVVRDEQALGAPATPNAFGGAILHVLILRYDIFMCNDLAWDFRLSMRQLTYRF